MFISRPDAQLFTVSFGAGPRTLVALGGWIGSWELWADPFSLLSPTWRTIAFDHRGTGATIAAAESITLQAMVEDLFEVLEALKVEKCVLAGESAGVAVVLTAALQQPQRFTGLVLVDGLYQREQPGGEDPFVHALQTQYQTTIDTFVEACAPRPEDEAVRRWGRQILDRSSPEAALRLYECLYGLDLRPQVRDIRMPSLVIHGEADRLVPVSASSWLASQLPDGRLVILPGAGHVPTMTHPQAVAQAIDQFFPLERTGA